MSKEKQLKLWVRTERLEKKSVRIDWLEAMDIFSMEKRRLKER